MGKIMESSGGPSHGTTRETANVTLTNYSLVITIVERELEDNTIVRESDVVVVLVKPHKLKAKDIVAKLMNYYVNLDWKKFEIHLMNPRGLTTRELCPGSNCPIKLRLEHVCPYPVIAITATTSINILADYMEDLSTSS